MSESVELLPCPFCESAMTKHGQVFSHPGNSCVLAFQGFRNELTEAWNTRALQSDITALREGLATLADGETWRGFSPLAQVQRMKEFANVLLNQDNGSGE